MVRPNFKCIITPTLFTNGHICVVCFTFKCILHYFVFLWSLTSGMLQFQMHFITNVVYLWSLMCPLNNQSVESAGMAFVNGVNVRN